MGVLEHGWTEIYLLEIIRCLHVSLDNEGECVRCGSSRALQFVLEKAKRSVTWNANPAALMDSMVLDSCVLTCLHYVGSWSFL